jgi:hypothetical protein
MSQKSRRRSAGIKGLSHEICRAIFGMVVYIDLGWFPRHQCSYISLSFADSLSGTTVNDSRMSIQTARLS